MYFILIFKVSGHILQVLNALIQVMGQVVHHALLQDEVSHWIRLFHLFIYFSNELLSLKCYKMTLSPCRRYASTFERADSLRETGRNIGPSASRRSYWCCRARKCSCKQLPMRLTPQLGSLHVWTALWYLFQLRECKSLRWLLGIWRLSRSLGHSSMQGIRPMSWR